MNRIKVLLLFFCGIIFSTNISSSTAYQFINLNTSHSGDPLFYFINPANILFNHDLAIQGYYNSSINNITNPYDESYGYSVEQNISKWSYLVHISHLKRNHALQETHFNLGYKILDNLYSGFALNTNFKKKFTFSGGLLYLLETNFTSYKFIGIHQVILGLSLVDLGWEGGQNFSFGFTLNLISHKYFIFNIGSAFFSNFTFRLFDNASGLDFDVAGYWKMRFNFFGDNIFKYHSYAISTEFNIPVLLNKFSIYAGMTQFFTDKTINQFIVGSKFQLSLKYLSFKDSTFKSKRVIHTKTDTKLVHYLKPQKYLTPNGDNKNDILNIHLYHSVMKEYKDWSIQIQSNDNSKTVIGYLNSNFLLGKSKLPEKITWNAVDSTSKIVSNGSYSLFLIALSTKFEVYKWPLGTIIVDTKAPTFSYYIEQKTIYEKEIAFLPIQLSFSYNDTQKVILKVVSKQKRKIFSKEYRIIKNKKLTVRWDSIKTALTGQYEFILEAYDFAGNVFTQKINNFSILPKIYKNHINNTVDIHLSYHAFSPNGDNFLDVLPIKFILNLQTSQIKKWEFKIYYLNSNNPVKNFKGQRIPPLSITWNGTSNHNKALSTGKYRLLLEIELRNGHQILSKVKTILLDITPPKIILNTKNAQFSPDNDGINDSLNLDMTMVEDSTLKEYMIYIEDQKTKTIIFTAKSYQSLPEKHVWYGNIHSSLPLSSFQKLKAYIKATDVVGNTSISNAIEVQTSLLIHNISTKIGFSKKSENLHLPNIEFSLGSYKPIKEAIPLLNQVATYLLKAKLSSFCIIGHTDNIGSRLYNIRLSKKRAAYIKKYLETNYPNLQKEICILGKGPDEPLVPNSKEAYRILNRRVEFRLFY